MIIIIVVNIYNPIIFHLPMVKVSVSSKSIQEASHVSFCLSYFLFVFAPVTALIVASFVILAQNWNAIADLAFGLRHFPMHLPCQDFFWRIPSQNWIWFSCVVLWNGYQPTIYVGLEHCWRIYSLSWFWSLSINSLFALGHDNVRFDHPMDRIWTYCTDWNVLLLLRLSGLLHRC